MKKESEKKGNVGILICILISILFHSWLLWNFSWGINNKKDSWIELDIQTQIDAKKEDPPNLKVSVSEENPPKLEPKPMKTHRRPKFSPRLEGPVSFAPKEDPVSESSFPEPVENIQELTSLAPEKNPPLTFEQSTNVSSTAERDTYFALLRGLIEKNKVYPILARRRNLQGEVLIRFKIDTQGKLVGLDLVGTCPHDILNKAAKEAVIKASPFPPPPNGLIQDFLEVELKIVFRLI